VGRIDRGWWIINGPNGGYLAAIVLRAMTEAVGDQARHARSFTLHYLSPPVEGPITIHPRVLRTGRTLSTVTAEGRQGDKLVLQGIAAFAASRSGGSFCDLVAPEFPPAGECPPLTEVVRGPVELQNRYASRWALGVPFSGDDAAECGGWIRLAGERVVDALTVAAFTDAFPPALFTRATGLGDAGPVPTIDLTIHFRSPLPLPEAAADEYCAVRFRTSVAADGYIEEDSEVWSEGGVLLAQSRQLAIG
jgi:acyl-CoA thioesterase